MSIYIGADPGTSNYAYSILGIKTSEVKILEVGMFLDTITNLTQTPAKLPKSKRRKKNKQERIPPFNHQFYCFKQEWLEILDKYKPVKMTAERFQSRGYQGSAVIEAVSMSNGILADLCDNKSIIFEIHIASSWKNNLNRYLAKANIKNCSKLDNLYKHLSNIPNHMVDATFICLFGVLKHTNKSWSDVDLKELIEQLKDYEYSK